MVVGYETKINRTKINQTKYNQTKINRGRNPTNCSIRSRDKPAIASSSAFLHKTPFGSEKLTRSPILSGLSRKTFRLCKKDLVIWGIQPAIQANL